MIKSAVLVIMSLATVLSAQASGNPGKFKLIFRWLQKNVVGPPSTPAMPSPSLPAAAPDLGESARNGPLAQLSAISGPGAVTETISAAMDGSSSEKPRSPIAFPDLASGIAASLGISRPSPAPIPPLPDFSRDADYLPKAVVGQIIERMGNAANWTAVSRYASNINTPEQMVRTEWARQDAIAIEREYFAQLNETQKKIARAAFNAGFAELPNFREIAPDHVTLDWINQWVNKKRPEKRGRL